MPQAPREQVAELGLPPGPDLSIWGLVTVSVTCHFSAHPHTRTQPGQGTLGPQHPF